MTAPSSRTEPGSFCCSINPAENVGGLDLWPHVTVLAALPESHFVESGKLCRCLRCCTNAAQALTCSCVEPELKAKDFKEIRNQVVVFFTSIIPPKISQNGLKITSNNIRFSRDEKEVRGQLIGSVLLEWREKNKQKRSELGEAESQFEKPMVSTFIGGSFPTAPTKLFTLEMADGFL